MALQSSGQIKISEIKAELGSSSNSLRALSAAAGLSVPDAMSEFYGYSSYSNTHYYSNDGVNDYVSGVWENYGNLNSFDWSVNFWVRQNQSTKTSQQLWDFNANTTINSGNSNNRMFIQYVASSNRIIVRLRTNSTNFDRQLSLHDNSSVTGVTNSSTGWTSGQRGNVNSDGFCMITVTYDASATTGASAFKVYWNGNEMTTTATSSNGTRSNLGGSRLTLCAATHSTTGGNSNIDIDEWAFYNDILTSAEATTLYNSGTIADASTLHTGNLIEAVRFAASNSADTYAGIYNTITVSGGSTNTYA